MVVKRQFFILFSTAVVLLASGNEAKSGLITYVETVTGSGYLDGQTYTSKLISLNLTVDSSSISQVGEEYISGMAAVTISVAGIGSDTFTGFAVLDDRTSTTSPIFGIAEDNQGGVMDISSPSLANYDLSTSIGPIYSPAPTGFGQEYPTTNGYFYFGSFSSSVEFQAFATVPEPSSLALCSIAISLAAFRARRSISLLVSRPHKH